MKCSTVTLVSNGLRIIRKNEGIKKYIGGGEESYGVLAGDFVRDKDAVSACALFAEIVVGQETTAKRCTKCWKTSTWNTVL